MTTLNTNLIFKGVFVCAAVSVFLVFYNVFSSRATQPRSHINMGLESPQIGVASKKAKIVLSQSVTATYLIWLLRQALRALGAS